MLTAIVPLVMIIVGALGYFASSNPKIQEVSRILFAAGAFALAFALSGKTFAI